jgi:hypothetical protein
MKKLLLPFLFLAFACNDFPRDPGHSFEEAKNSGLQVGVAINPPFTEYDEGNFSGSEIEIVEAFAEEKNLDVQYTMASESELIKMLEKHEMHLLIGGFDKKTLWNKKTGLSIAYDKKHVILVAKGENKLLFELEGFLFKYIKKE